MAKKNTPAKANLNDARWINTPFVYTKFCAGFTLMQQDLMFRVSDHIQEYIKKYFSEGRFKSSEIPRPLFSQQDLDKGLQPIRVNLSDLGVSPSNYGRIDSAVAEIFQLTVRVPRVDEKGRKVLEWFPVFSRAALPLTDNGFTYTNEAGVVIESVKKRGYIEFEINPHVADWAFDMSKGYINHPNTIAQIAKADCTPLLYSLLKNNCLRAHGAIVKAQLEPNDIREYLGLVYRDADKNITGYMYEKYSKFRTGILDKAQKDLQRMADLDQIDYTFTYEEIRREGKSTGDPIYIEFTLHKTRLGEARDSIQHRNAAERKLLDTFHDYCPDLNMADFRKLVASVDAEKFVDFTLYAYKDVRSLIERKQPDDVAAYIMKLLRTWIANNRPQRDLFSQVQEQPQPKPKPEPPTHVLGQYAEEWQQFMATYEGPLKPMLEKATHRGSNRGYMWIEFPDKVAYDAYCKYEETHKRETSEMMKIFQDIMGGLERGRFLVCGYVGKPRFY